MQWKCTYQKIWHCVNSLRQEFIRRVRICRSVVGRSLRCARMCSPARVVGSTGRMGGHLSLRWDDLQRILPILGAEAILCSKRSAYSWVSMKGVASGRTNVTLNKLAD